MTWNVGLANLVQEALGQRGLEADQGFALSVSAMNVCGIPLGPNANEPAGSDKRSSPLF